jgi:chemotaxis protein methyltransferase CheR
MMDGSNRLAIEGEFPFRTRDFCTIAQILMSEAGISLGENKANLVYSRLAKRLRALRLASFRDYCDLVTSPEGDAERGEMIAALTTNVTRFFREQHHFDHLRDDILPPLLAFAKKGGRLRFWSAACSSGEEPYSIGMTILSVQPNAPQHDVKILATDIDPNVIAFGEKGVYPESALESVPSAMSSRWFVPEARGFMRVGDALRALVSFRRLNLIGSWPMQGRFHAIFCRNVVIYFSHDTQTRVWDRMAPLLEPEGALYIGHSERINGPAERILKNDGITTYRLAAKQMVE